VHGFAGDPQHRRVRRRTRPTVAGGWKILVNNLGIFEPKSFEDIPDDD